MIRPSDWDTADAFTGEFKTIKPGGYICKILSAKTEVTRTGREQLIIMFDIAEGEFKNFYQEQYAKRSASNSDTKWQGIYRQLTGGETDKTNPFFKGMIFSIEASNNGYKWNWNEASLKGKFFGGVFGQEEYENSKGETKVATKLMFIRSTESIRNGVEVPEIKKLRHNGDSHGFNDASQFGNDVLPDVFPEEEIPF